MRRGQQAVKDALVIGGALGVIFIGDLVIMLLLWRHEDRVR